MICAGTGHRFITDGDGRVRRLSRDPIAFVIAEVVRDYLLNLKPSHFIGGGALGFDMIATDVARQLQVPYTLALPYEGYFERWEAVPRALMQSLIDDAAEVTYVSKPPYSRHKLTRRNYWMIDRADCVLALWDGRKGGTSETVLYAWSRRIPVHNIWRDFKKRTDENSL